MKTSVNPKRSYAEVGIFFLFAFLGLRLWKTQFGFDNYDDAFFISTGMRQLLPGASLFSTEYLAAFRHYDLLNYFFIKPLWMDSVIVLRLLDTATQFLLVMVWTHVAFRGRWTLFAALSAALLFGCQYLAAPGWSYYTWVRDAFLLHHTCLLLAFEQPRYRFAFLVFAGVAAGVAGVAHLPMGGAIAVSIGLWFLIRYTTEKATFPLKDFACYVGAFAATILTWTMVLTARNEWPSLTWATQWMLLQKEQMGNPSIFATLRLVPAILKRPEFWALLVLPLFVKIKKPVWAVIVASGFFVFWWGRKHLELETYVIFSTIFGLSGFAIVWMLQRKFRNPPFTLITLFTLSSAALVAGTSWVGAPQAISLLCLVLPLFASALESEAESTHSTVDKARNGLAQVFAMVGVVACVSYHSTETYHDANTGFSTYTVKASPLAGLKTSPIRGSAYDDILRVGELPQPTLTIGALPVVFLAPGTRPSHPTSYLDSLLPAGVFDQVLIRMLDESFTPRTVVVEKASPIVWGLQFPNNPDDFAYHQSIPITPIVRCAEPTRILSRSEFAILQISPEKFRDCIRDHLKSGR
jgi:hypothetical protein